jgi:hypothetical protein
LTDEHLPSIVEGQNHLINKVAVLINVHHLHNVNNNKSNNKRSISEHQTYPVDTQIGKQEQETAREGEG